MLQDEGLLIFSYHHSRDDGWLSVAKAVLSSNFVFTQAHPVKAEMSVATPKSQASSPIDIDILLVCKKQENDDRLHLNPKDVFKKAYQLALAKIKRFNKLGRNLSSNDVKVVFYSELLVAFCAGRKLTQFLLDFEQVMINAEKDIDELWQQQLDSKNELSTETIPNPQAGTIHEFIAYRPKSEPGPVVTLAEA